MSIITNSKFKDSIESSDLFQWFLIKIWSHIIKRSCFIISLHYFIKLLIIIRLEFIPLSQNNYRLAVFYCLKVIISKKLDTPVFIQIFFLSGLRNRKSLSFHFKNKTSLSNSRIMNVHIDSFYVSEIVNYESTLRESSVTRVFFIAKAKYADAWSIILIIDPILIFKIHVWCN